MSILEAIILGIIQGLTEFLPVSSSAHLVISERIMGVELDSLAFELTMHLGTLCAVVFAYRKKVVPLVKHPFSKQAKLIIAATIPTVIIVFVFNSMFRAAFSGEHLVYCFLITAILLLIADRRPRIYLKTKKAPLSLPSRSLAPSYSTHPLPLPLKAGATKDSSLTCQGLSTEPSNEISPPQKHINNNSTTYSLSVNENTRPNRSYGSSSGNCNSVAYSVSTARAKKELSFFDAIIIGITQGFAAFPGISRSGSTISVSMLLGNDKQTSADFSFLLSIPIILGSTVLELLTSRSFGGVAFLPLIAGFFASFIFGLIAIKILLRVLTRVGFDGFAIYLFCLSLFLLLNDNFLFLF